MFYIWKNIVETDYYLHNINLIIQVFLIGDFINNSVETDHSKLDEFTT